MTHYCVEFGLKRWRWRVRPEICARPAQVVTYYSRACRVADYLNWRLYRKTHFAQMLTLIREDPS